MDVISYRGPGAAGGVSSGLGNAWRQQQDAKTRWWFLSGDTLSVLDQNMERGAEFVHQLTANVVKGHYRYCNEFIWPLMHDLPQHVTYRAEDRALYRRFNFIFAQYVSFDRRGNYFIQDYQLALVPKLATESRCTLFWHIPFPKEVPIEFVEPLSEIARGMLSAHVIGFHTNEYVENFMHFVSANLAEYSVDEASGEISRIPGRSSPSLIEAAESGLNQPYIIRPFVFPELVHDAHSTKLVAKPLGIDLKRWQDTATANDITAFAQQVPTSVLQKPFVLSVDRADYTKAVVERLQIIDKFMEAHPERRGELSFVQVCGRSRAGLTAFDQYWQSCQSLYQQVNSRWQTDDWQPIYWLDKPLSAEHLSAVYSLAAVMLVNPVRDGLNLTAKEFVACQSENAGALLLSPHAGSWHEIGAHCLPADPLNPEQVVSSLNQALSMSPTERQSRNLKTKSKLERGTLSRWWRYFNRTTNALSHRRTASPSKQRFVASA